ncbi:peptide chain release factor 1 [archaeon]|nr:peptide chain release factor 1 [archaeon]
MMNKINKYQLKKLVEELKDMRSRHTELVSVYVPSGTNLNVVRNQIAQEQALAANIKSKTTRKNVQSALERAATELRYYKVTPENGLVVFAGNVSDNPAVDDFKSWSFEPPEELTVRIYRTEPTFVLEPLVEMIEPKYVYGLVVIDDKEVVFGLLKGKRIVTLKEKSSMVPGKSKAGGQSQRRFQRVRQEIVKHWYKSIGELCVKLFKSYDNLKGLLIGGPGPAKEAFISSGHLGVLKDKIITVQNIGHSGSVALEELVRKSQKALEKEEIMAEKTIVTEFLNHLGKDDGMAAYGLEAVKKRLKQGAVDKLLISESVDESLVDELVETAEQFSSGHELISTETREGEQLKQLGGVGAILRYKMKD